jgi:hypothetical protein
MGQFQVDICRSDEMDILSRNFRGAGFPSWLSRGIGLGLMALILCSCGANGFFKEINGRLDAGQVDKIPLEDLKKLEKGNTDYSQFVLHKWKILYNKKIFGNNADPTEVFQQTLQIEAAAKAGNKEAEAFLPSAQEYLQSINTYTTIKAKAAPAPALFQDGGPLEVLTLIVRPAMDMINNIYTYRKVQGVIRNRGDQMVANATVSLKCFDGDGKPLGSS